MLQSAYFASQAGGDDDAVIGALIHDVGHFTSELGAFAMDDVADRLHEDAGAMLIEGFCPKPWWIVFAIMSQRNGIFVLSTKPIMTAFLRRQNIR